MSVFVKKESFKELRSAWSPEDAKSHLEYFSSKGQLVDLVVRIAMDGRQELFSDFFLKYFAQNDWKRIIQLMKVGYGVGNLVVDDLMKACHKLIEKIPERVRQHLEGEDEGFPISEAMGIFRLYFQEFPLDLSVTGVLLKCSDRIDQHKEKLKKLAAEKDYEALAPELLRISDYYEIGGIQDTMWHKCRGSEVKQCLDARREHYLEKISSDRVKSLAEKLLSEGEIPEHVLQRKQIFRYLFHATYLEREGGADQKLVEQFLIRGKAAAQRLAGINLEWFTQDKARSIDKLKFLHLCQCLCPPSPLVDFFSSFLIMKKAQAEANSGPLSQQLLIQAELQLPDFCDACIQCRDQYPRLTRLVAALKEQIFRSRIGQYLSENRLAPAIPYLIESLHCGHKWARPLLVSKMGLFKRELDKLGEDELFMLILTLAPSGEEGSDLSSMISETAGLYASKAEENMGNEDPDICMSGLAALYRSLCLGNTEAEALSLIDRYRNDLHEQSKNEFHSLTYQMGDVLGNAMALSTVESGNKAYSEKIGKLYDQFKDVLMQQRPYEAGTQEMLKGIMNEAQALIEEAENINRFSQVSTYEKILSKPSDDIHKWMLSERDSLKNLIVLRYLEDKNIVIFPSEKEGSETRVIPEHLLCRRLGQILVDLVISAVRVNNNPLLNHLGMPFEIFLNFGILSETLRWFSPEELIEAERVFPKETKVPQCETVVNDRYAVAHLLDWVRFENAEALKVPYRKAMSVVCAHIADGIVSIRSRCDELMKTLEETLAVADKDGAMLEIVRHLRRATCQINTLDIYKRAGILPKDYDRSTEPRVRSFIDSLNRQFHNFPSAVREPCKVFLSQLYVLDKNEFQLGMLLKGKEQALKKYLHINLESLVKSHLKESNRNSIQNKILDILLRVQQGITLGRSDMRNVRFSPVYVGQEGDPHTAKSVLEMLEKFEENMPIIDRVIGSRQTFDTEMLIFSPNRDGIGSKEMGEYMEKVDGYLANAMRLARQLRIVIVPGVGTGNFDEVSFSLCLPLRPGRSRSREIALLSALADYLYYTKLVIEDPEGEEPILNILNKKAKSTIKPGTQEARTKVVDLIFKEIASLNGIRDVGSNPSNISGLLIKLIIGSDNTMIYRELRKLSAPQKMECFNKLREKFGYPSGRLSAEKAISDLIVGLGPLKKAAPGASTTELSSLPRLFHSLPKPIGEAVLNDIYDLAVLLYHYKKVDECFSLLSVLIKLSPTFSDALWGLGTAARSLELTVLPESQKAMTSMGFYKRFADSNNAGIFWKKRAQDLIKKLMSE
ncbi:MAG: hypothetical protein HQL31_01825 [Planctomycetes bacterium]|nr:hypothetical protein [Planctomycetota bacterium]